MRYREGGREPRAARGEPSSSVSRQGSRLGIEIETVGEGRLGRLRLGMFEASEGLKGEVEASEGVNGRG